MVSDGNTGEHIVNWKQDFISSLPEGDAWKKSLIEKSEEKWRCNAIYNCKNEYIGNMLSRSGCISLEWKAILVSQIEENDLWKARYICKVDDNWEFLGHLILKSDREWKGIALSKCGTNTQAEMVLKQSCEYKAVAICSAETITHAQYLQACTEDWKLAMMNESKEHWKWPLLQKCSKEWQGKLIITASQKWHAELILECVDYETIASHIESSIPVWKANILHDLLLLNFVSKDELFWRWEVLINCELESVAKLAMAESKQWKAVLLAQCSFLSEALLIKDEGSEARCQLITRGISWEHSSAIRECLEDWRAFSLDECRHDPWKWNFLKKCKHEWQANLILMIDQNWQASAILKCPNSEFIANAIAGLHCMVMPKWKTHLLFKVIETMTDKKVSDWKIYSLFECDNEECCKYIIACSHHWQASQLMKTSSRWKLDAIMEAEYEWQVASISDEYYYEWKWKYIKCCEREWQAVLVFQSTQHWKAEAIIFVGMDYEYVAYHISELQKWKWDILQKIIKQCRTDGLDSKSNMWKIEILTHVDVKGITPSKAQFIFQCEQEWKGSLMLKICKCAEKNEDWRLQHILEEELEWKCTYLTNIEEKWRLDLIKHTSVEWQVEIICKCPDVWKVKHIAKLTADDRELAALILSEAVTSQQQVDDIKNGNGVFHKLFY